jgi:hypothetical protein
MTLGVLSVLAEISIVSDSVRQMKSKFLQKFLADKSTFTFFPFYLPARFLCLPILPSKRKRIDLIKNNCEFPGFFGEAIGYPGRNRRLMMTRNYFSVLERAQTFG